MKQFLTPEENYIKRLEEQLASAQAEIARLNARSSEPVGWILADGLDDLKHGMFVELSKNKEELDDIPLYIATPYDEQVETLNEKLLAVQAENLKLREALGRDPVHWRVVLVTEIPDGVPIPTARIVGFQCKKEAEQFIAEKKDFKGWEYRLEPLYLSPSDTTALTEYVTHAVAKRLEELGSWVTNEATHRAYRDSVLEDCAKVCEASCNDVVADICAKQLRAMKEKK